MITSKPVLRMNHRLPPLDLLARLAHGIITIARHLSRKITNNTMQQSLLYLARTTTPDLRSPLSPTEASGAKEPEEHVWYAAVGS